MSTAPSRTRTKARFWEAHPRGKPGRLLPRRWKSRTNRAVRRSPLPRRPRPRRTGVESPSEASPPTRGVTRVVLAPPRTINYTLSAMACRRPGRVHRRQPCVGHSRRPPVLMVRSASCWRSRRPPRQALADQLTSAARAEAGYSAVLSFLSLDEQPHSTFPAVPTGLALLAAFVPALAETGTPRRCGPSRWAERTAPTARRPVRCRR